MAQKTGMATRATATLTMSAGLHSHVISLSSRTMALTPITTATPTQVIITNTLTLSNRDHSLIIQTTIIKIHSTGNTTTDNRIGGMERMLDMDTATIAEHYLWLISCEKYQNSLFHPYSASRPLFVIFYAYFLDEFLYVLSGEA